MMNNRYVNIHNDDHNLFLTATSSQQNSLPSKKSQHSPSHHYLKLIQPNLQSQQSLKINILSLIKEFKTLQNSPEISHLFNEILYGLDNFYGEKKNIDKIAELLQSQRNVIKLTRVWNKLKTLKKQFDRFVLDKNHKTQPKINHQQKNSSSKIQLNRQISSSNTFHRTMPSQVDDLKQNILSQISYRERLMKIQSEREKHEQNRQKFIQKKFAKAKQMNKKVKEIYLKKKKQQTQQISKHKYQQLYDPEEQRFKKRGKTVNLKENIDKDSSLIENEVILANIRSNERCATIKVQFQQVPMSRVAKLENKTKKNIKFLQKDEQKFTKQDLMTFKSLKEIINHNLKGSKSFKNLTKGQQTENSYNTLAVGQRKQLYTKLPNQQPNRCYSLGKNENIKDNDFAKSRQEQRLNSVISKKLQMQEQRFRKIITEAVQKEKKILRIYQRRTLQVKTKKNSPQGSQHDLTHLKSFDSSPSKRMFKKPIFTRKELFDKEKKIFANIENKIQNKEHFLQERVQKIRQRLKRQQMTKEKHQQACEEYLQFSETISVMNSSNGSPQKKQKEKWQKHQQKIVKNSYFTKLKKMQSNSQNEKLAGLSMQQLKKKLVQIDSQEAKKNQQKIVF